MPRWCLRLVSCLSLVAYLLANTHLNLALAACAPPACTGKAANKAEDETDTKPATNKCQHCAKHNPASPHKEIQAKGKLAQHDPACPGCPDCPSGPSCPCCPHQDPSCPVPGGCALCNIAKAPCLTPLFALDASAPLFIGYVVEYTSAHVPPFCDELTRPPRA